MKCAFVGAGAVAEKYASELSESSLELTAVCDRSPERAERLAVAYEATPYTDLDELLRVESAPLLVNLTSHEAHAPVTRDCLEADRHVYSEKPLALDAGEANALVSMADRRGLALGCAPINHRGDAQRHVERFLGDGRFGPIRLGYAHAHVGRVNDWHDSPDSYLSVGPLYDGAVYPLNLLIRWFGPVTRIRSADAIDVWPDTASRSPGRLPHVESTIEFESGLVVRLTASFYTPHRSREFNSLELHGDEGSLYLDDSGALVAETETVRVGGLGREYVAAPYPYPGRELSYADGPERLAWAISRGNRPTVDAKRAAHIVAICNAIETTATDGGPLPVVARGGERQALETVPGRPGQREHERANDDRGQRSTAIRMPPVGFGCSRYRDGTYVDRIDSIATALDAGYRLLDSAELYGNEERIGELLDAPGSPDREGLFLISKVWNTNHEHVAEACEGSLDALDVDALDCYMLHWPESWTYQGPLRNLASMAPAEQEALTFPTDDNGRPATVDVPLSATWRRMEKLYDRGLTRTLGACNISLDQLETLTTETRILPAVVQIESHPYRPQTALIDACHRRGIRVMAHSPLSADGLLEEPILEAIADEHDVSPAAIVVAWNVDRGVVPIPASNDRAHIVANLVAARIRLNDSDRERIARLYDPAYER